MPSTSASFVADSIRAEFEATRVSFYTLLDSLSEADWQRQSLNPGWTNGEILVHMVFGFITLLVLVPLARIWGRFPKGSSRPFAQSLNFFTRPFNWVNAQGARFQSRVLTYKRIGSVYDRVHFSLLKRVASIRDEEWGHGMYYPTRWDANFNSFMSLEDLFHYPVVHFNFHCNQIATKGGTGAIPKQP